MLSSKECRMYHTLLNCTPHFYLTLLYLTVNCSIEKAWFANSMDKCQQCKHQSRASLLIGNVGLSVTISNWFGSRPYVTKLLQLHILLCHFLPGPSLYDFMTKSFLWIMLANASKHYIDIAGTLLGQFVDFIILLFLYLLL